MSITVPDNVFLINPDNDRYIYGDANKPEGLNPNAGCQRLFLGFFVIGGIAVTLAALFNLYNTWRFIQEGVPAQATITDKREYQNDTTTDYYITYQYVFEDVLYTDEKDVPRVIYDRSENGYGIPIMVLPSRPGWTEVGTEATWKPAAGSVIFAIVANALIITAIAILIRQTRNYTRLARFGEIIIGEIMESSIATNSKDGKLLKLTFRFRSPKTMQFLTKEQLDTEVGRHINETLPQPGTPVVVIYMDDHTFAML